MRMISRVLVGAALLAAVSDAAQAQTQLIVNGGWQFETVSSAGTPGSSSPWTFTLAGAGKLWFADCCVGGDVWTLSGDINAVSTFFAGGPLHSSLDPIAEWASDEHSKILIDLGPGTYEFSVAGNGAGGLPAGAYLAVTQSVPEPSTWAMMAFGLVGMMGVATRRRGTAHDRK
jgi:hypothetical protein